MIRAVIDNYDGSTWEGMKILKVVCVAVGCFLMGALLGGLVASWLLPPDSTGRGAPGDGILIIWCIGAGVLVSLLVAAFLSVRIIWPPVKTVDGSDGVVRDY